MSYHGVSGSGAGLPDFSSTTAFAQAVDPYTWRFSPPGAVYSPYGWGPDFNIGMPMRYTHHIGYERTPIPGARRVGPMYDELQGLGAARTPPRPILPVWTLSQVAMWASGHPRVPAGATHYRMEKLRDDTLWIRYFAGRRDLGVRKARWRQTLPPVPPTQTPMVYTETGAWGPTVTPESVVGEKIPVAFPPNNAPSFGNYERDYAGVFASDSGPYEAESQRLAGLDGILAVL